MTLYRFVCRFANEIQTMVLLAFVFFTIYSLYASEDANKLLIALLGIISIYYIISHYFLRKIAKNYRTWLSVYLPNNLTAITREVFPHCVLEIIKKRKMRTKEVQK